MTASNPTAAQAPVSERRQHARRPLVRPAKLRCDQAPSRYLTAATQDISAAGARLRLEHASRLVPGQRIRLGVPDHPRQAVLSADQMIDATVVRSLGHGSVQHIAVRFEQPSTLALAG